MALTIQENKDATQDRVVADRKIWVDAEGQAVEDGDPAAKILFCTAGTMVSKAKAKELGIRFKKPAATKKKTTKATTKKKGS
ncbi:MAG: hypothetical protein GY898_23220 [Proteobacteria bacterium]|nr:hypothetical protein [Pseudomonadota bacterium]